MKITARHGLAVVAAVAVVGATIGFGSFAGAANIGEDQGGPLVTIDVSPDLNCDVRHVDDTHSEFYGQTACGTFVATGGVLYGPAVVPAGNSASPRTPFTPFTQTGGTGSGDDHRVETIVDAVPPTGGDSVLRITEVDTYVPGNEFYRTDVTLSNPSDVPVEAIVYRAGDCYLDNNDQGFGRTDGERVACVNAVTSEAGAVPGERVIEWIPLTAGSNYLEDHFDDVWAAVGTQQPFPDSCAACTSVVDNGAGLSWTVSVPESGSATVSHLTAFSPIGASNQPPVASNDDLVVEEGAVSGSTDVLANDTDPDEDVITIDDWTDGQFGTVDCAGATCTYTPGPNFAGDDNFTYTIIDTLGNQATATVTVSSGTPVPNTAPVAGDDTIYVDAETGTGGTDLLANDSDPDGDDLSVVSHTDPAFGTVSCEGSLCTYTAGDGFEGTDSFTYTVSDGTDNDQGTVRVTSAECPEVAAALDGGDLVTGESWVECSSPTANAIVGELTPVLKPVGGTSVLLTSGDVSNAPGPDDDEGATAINGTEARGANDVSVLRLDLLVPEGADCLSFDFVFGSEEYIEFVGSPYNDAFIAELDESTWTVSGSTISAPRNFAVDPDGRIISINSGFFSTENVVTDSGMQYDGTTPKLIARTGVTPGPHSLFLSIFDSFDSALDSGALVDNLQTYDAPENGCTAGASLPDPGPGPGPGPGPFEPGPFVPTDPTPPTEPTDPTPTEPTDPTPTEPTDPTPTEPTDPTPTEPTDPTPTEPAEPTGPTSPTEPTSSPTPVRPPSVITTDDDPEPSSTDGDGGSGEVAAGDVGGGDDGSDDADGETEVLGDVTGTLRLAAPSAVPGGEVVLSGAGCEPGERVQLLVNGDQFDSVRADDDGGFEFAGALPDELAIGQHELQARCSGTTLSALVDVVVTTSAGASASSAGVVLAFFLLLALLFTQGRGTVAARRDEDEDVEDEDLVGV